MHTQGLRSSYTDACGCAIAPRIRNHCPRHLMVSGHQDPNGLNIIFLTFMLPLIRLLCHPIQEGAREHLSSIGRHPLWKPLHEGVQCLCFPSLWGNPSGACATLGAQKGKVTASGLCSLARCAVSVIKYIPLYYK